uniref:Uncharacterized protein n=1 Tax=Anguilla anguilla TaxID=7936 RepID=A0A0E9USD9_ANGAN
MWLKCTLSVHKVFSYNLVSPCRNYSTFYI